MSTFTEVSQDNLNISIQPYENTLTVSLYAGLKKNNNITGNLSTTVFPELSYDNTWCEVEYGDIDETNTGKRILYIRAYKNLSGAERSCKIYLKYNSKTSDNYLYLTQDTLSTVIVFRNPTNYDFYTTADIYVMLTAAGTKGFDYRNGYNPVVVKVDKNTVFIKNGTSIITPVYDSNQDINLLISNILSLTYNIEDLQTYIANCSTDSDYPLLNGYARTVGYNKAVEEGPLYQPFIGEISNNAITNNDIDNNYSEILTLNIEICCFAKCEYRDGDYFSPYNFPDGYYFTEVYPEDKVYQISKIYDLSSLQNKTGKEPLTFYDNNLKPVSNTYKPVETKYGHITYPGELCVNGYIITLTGFVEFLEVKDPNSGAWIKAGEYGVIPTDLIIFTIKNNKIYALYFEKHFEERADCISTSDSYNQWVYCGFILSADLESKKDRIYELLNGINLDEFGENTKYEIDTLNINSKNDIYVLDNNMSSYDLFFPDCIIINGENIVFDENFSIFFNCDITTHSDLSNTFDYLYSYGFVNPGGYGWDEEYPVYSKPLTNEIGYDIIYDPDNLFNDSCIYFNTITCIHDIWKTNILDVTNTGKDYAVRDEIIKYYGIMVPIKDFLI